MRAGAFVSFVAGLLAATSATLTVWQSSYRQPRAGLAHVCEQNPTKLQQYTHHFFFGRLVRRFRTGWMKRQLDNAENLYGAGRPEWLLGMARLERLWSWAGKKVNETLAIGRIPLVDWNPTRN